MNKNQLTHLSLLTSILLPYQDSNLDKQNQNLLRCHYAIGQKARELQLLPLAGLDHPKARKIRNNRPIATLLYNIV
jgi:hypothetical protein